MACHRQEEQRHRLDQLHKVRQKRWTQKGTCQGLDKNQPRRAQILRIISGYDWTLLVDWHAKDVGDLNIFLIILHFNIRDQAECLDTHVPMVSFSVRHVRLEFFMSFMR